MRILTTVLLISILVAGCGRKEKPEMDLPVRPVNFVEVSGDQTYKERDFSGTIVPKVITELSFRVSGTISERYMDLGSKVNKGDVLAKLDPTDYQLTLNRAEAIYRNSKANFERDKILYLENSISKAQYENSLSEFKVREAEVNTARMQLNYTSLTAPSSGEIALVNAEVNQAVSAKQTIFLLNQVGELEIEFTVADVDINRIQLGQKVTARVIATGAEVKGVISNIGSVSTAYGKTFPVKASLFNVTSDMKAGMIVSLKVSLDEKKGKTVPGISVIKDRENRDTVFVITNVDEKDNIGTIERRVVTVGEMVRVNVEILSGLEVGDRVVTDGASTVVEGQRVMLRERGRNL